MEILRSIKLTQNDGEEMSDIIFNEVFGTDKDDVNADEFLKLFLHDKQNQLNANIEDVKKIFSRLNDMDISGAKPHLNSNGKSHNDSIDRIRFGEYLASCENDVYNPDSQTVDKSTLSQPLSEYWINSSHNTYLTGDQLKSFSSVEMYVVGMQR